MSRGVALLAVAALFLAGVVAGALGMHLYYAHGPGPPPAGGPPFGPGPEGGPRRGHGPAGRGPLFGDRLVLQLDLTPEQRERVERILAAGHEEAERLRRELAPQVREQVARVHDRIREVLTPEQRERFDELLRGHQRRRGRWLGPGP